MGQRLQPGKVSELKDSYNQLAAPHWLTLRLFTCWLLEVQGGPQEGDRETGRRTTPGGKEEPEQSENPGRKRSLDNEGALTLLSLAIREGEYVL